MKILIDHNGISYRANLARPLDLSYPLTPGSSTPKCFWAPDIQSTPVRSGDWVGSTQEGGAVNFHNVLLNPHGNGTHTECVGHIAQNPISVQESFDKYHFIAELISCTPRKHDNGDLVVHADQITQRLKSEQIEAVILRTLPNDRSKKCIDYSGTNPSYLDPECMKVLIDHGVQHFLLDLPSVDREQDEGQLSAHKSYWQYPSSTHDKKTITELVYVDNQIQDGLYLLEIQVAPLVLDASPSRPVLYALST